jgi:hypothetical protein
MMRQGGYLRDEADAEAALQRILDATIEAGGVLTDNFHGVRAWRCVRDDECEYMSIRDVVWRGIVFTCIDWLDTAQRLTSRVRADYERRLKRIIGAAQVIQRELSAQELSDLAWGPKTIDQAKDLEREAADSILWRHSYWERLNESPVFAPLLTGSIVPLVGTLVQPFERAFPTSPKYTTDDSGTDGPFIRFVEQTFCEFGITKDGNQPYMRRSIADALNEFKKRGS